MSFDPVTSLICGYGWVTGDQAAVDAWWRDDTKALLPAVQAGVVRAWCNLLSLDPSKRGIYQEPFSSPSITGGLINNSPSQAAAIPDPTRLSDVQFLLQHLTEVQQAAILWFRTSGHSDDVNSGGSRGPTSDTVRELLSFTVGDPRTEVARTVKLIEDSDNVRPTSRVDRWMRLTSIGLEIRKALVLNSMQ